MEFITSPPTPTSPSILIIQQICSANTREGEFLANFIAKEKGECPSVKIEPALCQSDCQYTNIHINTNVGL